MIHPDTELRFVSPEIGSGIFATAMIPMGTIVYVQDQLDIELSPAAYQRLDAQLQEQAEKYSFIDERGYRIVSWDTAKYVNHSCHCNTISTGYWFEMAIRDIHPDEELTDEYGLFNLQQSFSCGCGSARCRGTISADDIDVWHPLWDSFIKAGMVQMLDVDQPLWHLMADDDQTALMAYLNGRGPYRSVTAVRCPSVAAQEQYLAVPERKVKAKSGMVAQPVAG